MKTFTKLTTTASLTAAALCFLPAAPQAAAQDQDAPKPKAAADAGVRPVPAPGETHPSSATTTSAEKSPKSAAASAESANASATASLPPAANPGASSQAKVQLESPDAKDHTDRKLAGHKVRGSDGKDLGNLQDFLVDPQSGRVSLALVSSGGVAGIGDKVRMVPFAALKPGGKDNEFTLPLGKAEWEQVAVLKDEQLKDGQLTLADGDQRQLAATFGIGKSDADAGYTASLSSRLVRASDLHGKDVQLGTRSIGSIEGLVIDPTSGSATALFDAKRDFTSTRQKFLVPLARLELSANKKVSATTTLTQEDFEQAAGGNTVASSAGGAAPASPVAAAAPSRATPATAGTTRDQALATATDNTAAASSSAAAQTSPIDRGAADQMPTPAATANSRDSIASTGASASASPSLTAQTAPERTGENLASSAASTRNAAPSAPATTDLPSSASLSDNRAPQGAGTTADPQKSAASAESVAAQEKTQAKPAGTPGDNSSALDKNSPTAGGLAATTPSTTTDPVLTPTGQTSAEQLPAGADPALVTAAQSIRKALDDDTALARLDVRVTPQAGKLTLRGTVASESQKKSIEEKARKAASGAEIDNQIAVGNQ